MDPSQDVSESQGTKKKGLLFLVLQWILALLLPIVFLLSLPFLVGFIVVIIANSSITIPMSMPTQCKIVSSSVDIRSSKVCELGLLNYKANHVFHPFERNKFRCRYDYYWASVFKVEYKDHFSGQTLVALAEAPNEALPLHCRPSFGAAWLTQYKFKVNETYQCWYTSGISKVRLYLDDIFSCHPDEPSLFETIRQYSILTMDMVNSWFSNRRRAKYLKWETLAGLVSGFSTSLISIGFVRFVQRLLSSLNRFHVTWKFPRPVNLVLIKRGCLLLAYLSFVAWLVLQYGKRLGLTEIFSISKLWHFFL
ncbi:hypothetical protein L6164_027460 [Bauhinia variegata]|uniref:Uncharacterized protein n=1 Tax=Bauhinia variegata TaxID=167791 RepID=A0ACB9LT85_BAUVA|nr:hypothetical protein L6164_027460 [Bauhinia variegata]